MDKVYKLVGPPKRCQLNSACAVNYEAGEGPARLRCREAQIASSQVACAHKADVPVALWLSEGLVGEATQGLSRRESTSSASTPTPARVVMMMRY